jgi:hypothetical protein
MITSFGLITWWTPWRRLNRKSGTVCIFQVPALFSWSTRRPLYLLCWFDIPIAYLYMSNSFLCYYHIRSPSQWAHVGQRCGARTRWNPDFFQRTTHSWLHQIGKDIVLSFRGSLWSQYSKVVACHDAVAPQLDFKLRLAIDIEPPLSTHLRTLPWVSLGIFKLIQENLTYLPHGIFLVAVAGIALVRRSLLLSVETKAIACTRIYSF